VGLGLLASGQSSHTSIGSYPFMMPLTAAAMLSNCVLMLTNGRGQVAINSERQMPLGGPLAGTLNENRYRATALSQLSLLIMGHK